MLVLLQSTERKILIGGIRHYDQKNNYFTEAGKVLTYMTQTQPSG